MAIQVQLALLLFFYKVLTLMTGLAFAYMGYRLFMADKVGGAGDFSANAAEYGLSLRGGAPGVFFAFFGTVLVCFSVFRGLSYELGKVEQALAAPPASLLIPEELPKGKMPNTEK